MSKQKNYPNGNKGTKKNSKYSKKDGSNKSNSRGQGRGNNDSIDYGGNDVAWYNRNPEMLSAAARVPFAYQPGRRIPYEAINDDGESIVPMNPGYNIPGILSLKWVPSVGKSNEISSPINICAREMYARIRSKYSGALEADAPDIMAYMIIVDGLYAFIEDMKRVYYLVNQYTPYNTLYPKAAVHACGYDFDDLLANKTLFYQRIVEACAILKKFRVPDRMDLFKRHQFMSANIYADRPEAKSQHYLFSLNGIYCFSNPNTSSDLTLYDFAKDISDLTVQSAWDTFKAVSDPLMEWDTGYTIAGYLERAYEGEAFLEPSPVIEDAVLAPVYNAEVLMQIQNATVLSSVDIDSFAITSSATDNVIKHNPRGVDTTGFHMTAPLITIPTNGQPSELDIALATRLTLVVDSDTSVHCATEVLYDGRYYVTQNGNYENTQFKSYNSVSSSSSSSQQAMLWSAMNLSAFEMHPAFVIVYTDANNGNEYVYPLINTTNITTVDKDALTNLHRVCTYSEFNVFN